MHRLIPVTLLTGFLGSGKTTLLNKLVSHPEMSRCLVIINEFGDIPLDHLLVSHSKEELVIEMSSGCVCCTVRKDLATTLKNVLWRFCREGERQFDRVIIETTGLADPVPIIHTLITDLAISENYRLDGIVTLVDSVTGKATLDAHDEAVRQAAIADKLLITKTDLASESDLIELSHLLDALNPAAEQVSVEQGNIEPTQILGLGLFDSDRKNPDIKRWLNQEAYTTVSSGQGGKTNYLAIGMKQNRPIAANKHDARISSFCYVVDAPMQADIFESWIGLIMDLMGQKMLRVKGIVNVYGTKGPVIIHGVQHIFHPPAFLEKWPSDDQRTRVVFITRDIHPNIINGIFRQFEKMNSAWEEVTT